jgi:hypothetical protein
LLPISLPSHFYFLFFANMALQWNTATEDEIIRHCSRSNPDRNVISELEGGLSVIRISEDAAVKCGFGVTLFEATNQQQAYEMLNPAIIRIPKVYRFFTSGADDGYLIMEYINGQPISSMPDPDIYLEPMAKVLNLFEQVQRDTLLVVRRAVWWPPVLAIVAELSYLA